MHSDHDRDENQRYLFLAFCGDCPHLTNRSSRLWHEEAPSQWLYTQLSCEGDVVSHTTVPIRVQVECCGERRRQRELGLQEEHQAC